MFRYTACLAALFLCGHVYADSGARVCSPQKIAEITAAADQGAGSVQIDCSATLPAGSRISKTLVFGGAAAAGVVFDCNGAAVVRQGRGDNVRIQSLRRNGAWQRPHDITLRNCRIDGALRISGMDDAALREASRIRGSSAAIQAAAPTRILLDNLTIRGSGRIPLYLRPGVTEVTLQNSRISGQTDGTAVYLDAESARNILRGNIIDTEGKREAVAVDGSADNLIEGNRFLNVRHGGIFLYRNCGERGVIRQQTPSRNLIRNNDFANRSAGRWQPVIWIGSRNSGRYSYCEADAGYAFGSSADNGDFARDNVAADNVFDRYIKGRTVREGTRPNRISGNRSR